MLQMGVIHYFLSKSTGFNPQIDHLQKYNVFFQIDVAPVLKKIRIYIINSRNINHKQTTSSIFTVVYGEAIELD